MEIFKLFGSVMVDNSKANDSISKTEQKAEGLGSKLGAGIKTAAKWGAAIGGAAIVAGGALLSVANKASTALDRVDKLSQKIGISRKGFQEWDYVLSQSGADIEKMQVGMKTLVQRMDEATQGAGIGADAFASLGLSAIDSTGAMKSQEQMFDDTVTALMRLPEGAEKSRLAFELFGKAGTELMPMLNGAEGSVEALKERANELGLVMSDEAVDAGVLFGDTMDDLKGAFTSLGTKLGAEVMPMFIKMADWIIANLPAIKENIGKMVDGVKEIIEGFQVFWEENGETIKKVLSTLFEAVKTIIEVAMGIIKGVIDVVMGIIQGDWAKVWGGLEGILKGVFELIKTALSLALDGLIAIIVGIGTAAKNAGKAMFTAVWDGMKEIWTSLSTWVSDKIEWLIDKLAFWRKSEKEMSGGSNKKPDGKKASGLAYVPFDGYTAELHRGEEVVSLQDRQSISAQITNALSAIMDKPQQNGAINLSVNLNGKTIAQETYSDFVEEGKRRGALVGV